MGITERRIRQKEEVRTAILETAWNMVEAEGWQSLSIRKIADAIEYSVPVIYDHFKNKEAILYEFVKEGFRLLAAKLLAAKEKQTTEEEQIRAMADAYWNFAFQNQEHYQLMFSLGMAGCEMGQSMPEKAAFRNVLVEPIDLLLKKHNKTNVNPCLKYHTIWSVMHGLISIKMMNKSDVSDELNKMVLDDAVNGFIKNLKG
ncbi:MAG: TetR/AcrR family transcriptional regulator [Chitinophagaceae bacterium]|nr:MAG: TetR/AcrR family transcriptional regulator [Chitinophagaceae bacterium]